MGGRSAPARDHIMENLIDDHLAQGSTVRTATEVADASSADNQAAEPPAPVRPHPTVVVANVPTRLAAPRPASADEGEGDNAADDETPTIHVAAVRPQPTPSASNSLRPIVQRAAYVEAAPAPKKLASAAIPPGWIKGPDAVAPTPPAKPKADADARPPEKAPSETTVAARSTDDSDDDDTPAPGKGWKIQIGATEDAAKATALLDRARLRDRGLLAGRQADDGEGPQGRRHALPRSIRRSRLGVRGISLPFPQEERVLLLRDP